MSLRSVCWSCLTLAVVLAGAILTASAQDAPAITTQLLGEEAYQLLTSFYEYDRDMPLEARVVGKEILPDCTREKVVFRVRDSWVVGYLGIPKTGSAPYPCVLALHPLTTNKLIWWEDGDYADGAKLTKALLNAGVAVFTPDAQYHGERMSSNGFEPPGVMVFEKRSRDMFVQTVVESRRAIDYLETRPEIDKSRVGVIGYSMGGMETFAVTALDTRVKVAVACATPDYPDPVVAPRNFARGLKDRPFLMLTGRNDPVCPAEQAQLLFDFIPGSKKEIVFFETDEHRLPADHVPKAAAWLQEGLKVERGGKQ